MRRGAMVAALVAAAGLMGCDVDSPAPRAATTPPPVTTAPAATTASPASALPPPNLGPEGYGALKLGMTKAQARATGLVTGLGAGDAGECGGPGDGRLHGGDPADRDSLPGWLAFSSRSNRLVAIYAIPGVRTPEGIGLGSTYDELHAAYPAWEAIGPDPTNGRRGVDVRGNPDAHYRIVVRDHKVRQLSLDSDEQDCYE
jgi:hypothetical protein